MVQASFDTVVLAIIVIGAFLFAVRLSMKVRRHVAASKQHIDERTKSVHEKTEHLHKRVNELHETAKTKIDKDYLDRRLDGLMDLLKQG